MIDDPWTRWVPAETAVPDINTSIEEGLKLFN